MRSASFTHPHRIYSVLLYKEYAYAHDVPLDEIPSFDLSNGQSNQGDKGQNGQFVKNQHNNVLEERLLILLEVLQDLLIVRGSVGVIVVVDHTLLGIVVSHLEQLAGNDRLKLGFGFRCSPGGDCRRRSRSRSRHGSSIGGGMGGGCGRTKTAAIAIAAIVAIVARILRGLNHGFHHGFAHRRVLFRGGRRVMFQQSFSINAQKDAQHDNAIQGQSHGTDSSHVREGTKISIANRGKLFLLSSL